VRKDIADNYCLDDPKFVCNYNAIIYSHNEPDFNCNNNALRHHNSKLDAINVSDLDGDFHLGNYNTHDHGYFIVDIYRHNDCNVHNYNC
jgi:hypothetical protein